MVVSAYPCAFVQSKLGTVAEMGLPEASMTIGPPPAALIKTDARAPRQQAKRLRVEIMKIE
jgi:hypothetical protein